MSTPSSPQASGVVLYVKLIFDVPEPFVPHPDTYGDFSDVSFEYVGAEHFNALWAQALATL